MCFHSKAFGLFVYKYFQLSVFIIHAVIMNEFVDFFSVLELGTIRKFSSWKTYK